MLLYTLLLTFLDITLVDLIDIFLVAVLLYQFYKQIKGSVAVKILIGIMILLVIYLLVNALEMELLSGILGQFLGVGIIAPIIIFQQEIRKFLISLGRSSSFNDAFSWRKSSKSNINIKALVDASRIMTSAQTGALIVFSMGTDLSFYANSGDKLDAELSKRILISIFNKYSPLHDGAVIIDEEGRILAARCILPVSDNDKIPASMGLRHRAGIGITEIANVLVMIISEETGNISLIRNGIPETDLTLKELREKLNTILNNVGDRREEIATPKKSSVKFQATDETRIS